MSGIVSGVFVNSATGRATDGATAKLWQASAFSSPPEKNDPLPGGGQVGSAVTTGSEHGSDGAYRFTSVAIGGYYVSIEYNGDIGYEAFHVGREAAASAVDDLTVNSVTTPTATVTSLVAPTLSGTNGYLTELNAIHAAFKGKPFHDVRAYGAVGDGTTDDTAAIQEALDAATSSTVSGSAGLVYFPTGRYRITSTLQFSGVHNFTLLGNGRRTSTIVNEGTGYGIEVVQASPTMQSFHMEAMGIEGNASSDAGLYIHGGNKIYIANCRFNDNGTWGLKLGSVTSQCNRITLISVECMNNYSANDTLGDGGGIELGGQTEQTWLYGCTLRGEILGTTKINSIGLRIQSSTNVVGIYGGDIVNHGRGISIVGTDAFPVTSITIDGVYMEQNDRGVYIAGTGSDAHDVSNVQIRGCTFTAIQDASHVFAQGIYVNRSQNVRIDGNDFRNTAGGGVGIAIDGSATKLQIGQNAVMPDFSGTYVSVVGGSPNYAYINRMMQTKRVTAGGGISAGTSGTIAVTWDSPFLDTSYTVVAVAFHSSASALLNAGVQAKTTTGCTIAVQNNDSISRTPTVEVIAFHD